MSQRSHDSTSNPSKPQLLLLSGLLCDSAVWASQLADLSSDFDVTTLHFSRFRSLQDMAAHALDSVEGEFSLVGHSMGARVALEIMRAAPDRVQRLALLSTGIHPAKEGEEQRRGLLVQLAHEQGMAALAKRWAPPMVGPANVANTLLMNAIHEMVERQTPEEFEGQVKALLDRPEVTSVLPAITCPVLLGVGRDDTWSPLAQHQDMLDAIPDAELVVFEGSGHMAPMEVPDAVTSALRRWMVRQPVSMQESTFSQEYEA